MKTYAASVRNMLGQWAATTTCVIEVVYVTMDRLSYVLGISIIIFHFLISTARGCLNVLRPKLYKPSEQKLMLLPLGTEPVAFCFLGGSDSMSWLLYVKCP